jgi:ATP-dependent DNA helicase RecG
MLTTRSREHKIMSEMTHRQILKLPESKTLEFKQDLSSLEPVLKTLVAFANTAGGVLIVGKRNDGTISGVSDVTHAEERLANAIADGIRPALLPDIEIAGTIKKPLILVRVARWPGPFYLKKLGAETGVYLRLGSTNRRATPQQSAEMKRSSEHLAFDQLPCPGTGPDDLDMRSIKRAFGAVGRDIDEAKLESLGILTRYGRHLTPSNGGIILFGKTSARERYFPDAQIRCARFAGRDKVDFLDRLTIAGSVLEGLDGVTKFIRRNTRMAAKIESMRREDVPEYPAVALRETIVNAVAHTDYAMRGMQIMVAIYSDRLEIQNPGALPFGMTMDDLKAGVSRIRNPVIARVFRELDLMEKWGSGYKRITDACREGHYGYPEWVELGSVIRVVFPSLAERTEVREPINEPISEPINEPLGQRLQWFLHSLSVGERMTASDLAAHSGVSLATAKRDVSKLKKMGYVRFVGALKTGHYELTNKGVVAATASPKSSS